MTLATVALDDKYTLEHGRVFLSGTHALVRLLLQQRARDAARGLDTAGFVSGYRGSPLGGLDQQLASAQRFLEQRRIVFQPGLNEDLAATMLWGTQQLNLFPGAKVGGVFGMWYGKGPGVDRTGDAFRHANAAGTAPLGGVLAVFGDDHGAKSSTVACHSELAFIDLMMPVLAPATIDEIIDYGLYGFELSRTTGCWVALKILPETADASASISVAPYAREFAYPADVLQLPPDRSWASSRPARPTSTSCRPWRILAWMRNRQQTLASGYTKSRWSGRSSPAVSAALPSAIRNCSSSRRSETRLP